MILAMAAEPAGLEKAWSCLDHGDAAGAKQALVSVPEPAGDDRTLASWLDARSRVAWAEGRMDEAFATGIRAVVVSERTGRDMPSLTPELTPARAWVDAGTGLPRLVLPTGDGDGPALARDLTSLPEAAAAEGAWIVLAARLLDPAVTPPPDPRKAARSPRAEARLGFLLAAVDARRSPPAGGSAVTARLKGFLTDGSPMLAAARWFEAEAAAGTDSRLASLRFVHAAAAFDESPWLRARALERAAETIETIDPPEAARLRAAARKETP